MTAKLRNFASKKHTFEDAKSENKIRIKRLKKSQSKRGVELARKLSRCRSRSRCESPACAKCAFRFRKKTMPQIKSLVPKIRKSRGGKKDDCLATLIPPDAFMGSKALVQFNVARRHNSLSQQLNRSDLKDIVAIGITEGAYKGKLGKICMHQHIIAFCQDHSEFAKLRRFYKKRTGKVRPLKVEPIKPGTLSKVASYCLKFTTYGTGDFGYGKRRPPENDEVELLLFLDRHTFSQLMFLKGLRYEGGKLKLLNIR